LALLDRRFQQALSSRRASRLADALPGAMGLDPATPGWQLVRISADLLQPFPQAAAQRRCTAVA
jgi:hypothetical protein